MHVYLLCLAVFTTAVPFFLSTPDGGGGLVGVSMGSFVCSIKEILSVTFLAHKKERHGNEWREMRMKGGRWEWKGIDGNGRGEMRMKWNRWREIEMEGERWERMKRDRKRWRKMEIEGNGMWEMGMDGRDMAMEG